MAEIKPFRALRPTRDKAGLISAPSYDSGNREQSYQELEHNPYSYLHIVKPYLHFKGEKKNPGKHFPLGLEYLNKFKQEGWFMKDEDPAYYVYRVIKGSNQYTGIIAAAAVNDYMSNCILKHENTLTEKQNELAEHIHFFRQLGNPVLLTYPDNTNINSLIESVIDRAPEYNFISQDQLKHNLWVIDDPAEVQIIHDAFVSIPRLYIADGHHRSAGAAAYCTREREANPDYNGKEPFNYFPVCLIPFSKLHIYEYHRLVKDEQVIQAPGFMQKVEEYFDVTPSGDLPVQPLKEKEFGIYFRQKAYLLKLKPAFASQLNGILDNLDVSIVEEFILKRIFSIRDSKTDKRLSFMDGSKGIGHLQEAVDSNDFSIAITLFRTSIEEVKDVAENNLIMPPKSTWIEPKLRTGLVIYETN